MAKAVLYGYWRSSTSYRARIGLSHKGVEYEVRPLNMLKNEHADPEYVRDKNPMGAVPTLEIDGHIIVQSPAILEYLDETRPDPAWLPTDPADRAHIRAMAMLIACDIHPIANMSPLKYLKNELGHDQAEVDTWYRHWVRRGLNALEQLVSCRGRQGRYCFGDCVTLADIYLAPQMYNARRFNTDLSGCPTLVEIDARLQELPAFVDAQPERQIDAQ
jgi:maleylacetoacetate isomerase